MSGWRWEKSQSPCFKILAIDNSFILLYAVYSILKENIMMQRTQVYFEPEILELLREEARIKKATLASVIREKVEKTIKKNVKKKQMNAAEALTHLAELGERLGVNGPKDLSQRIDEFVYRT